MRESAITIAKWTWAVAVVAAVAVVLWRSRVDVARMLRDFPAWALLASFGLTSAAKLLLGENARLAAANHGLDLGYGRAARLYNTSQLGKYIPGSIWQFVGRAASYRELGAGYATIRDALLTESVWIVGGAAAFGAVLGGPALMRSIAVSLSPLVRLWFMAGFAAAALLLAVLLVARRARLLGYLRAAAPGPRACLVQAGIWLLLGLGFHVLCAGSGIAIPVVFSIGLFAAAYAMGFMVPIAPAGLGVRDGILVLGLLPGAGSMGEAIAVTALARIIYLAVELVLVGVQGPVSGIVRAARTGIGGRR